MSTIRPVLIISLVALLCFYSCDDDNNPIGGGGGVNNPFPNAVGMLWKYEVFDSLTDATDTVWVSVTNSELTRCGYTKYSWRTYWITRDSVVDQSALVWIDTAMVEIVVDSPQEPALLERFVFPLEEGASWNGPSIYDTCRVTEIGTVTVPAGTFHNSALVEHAWNMGLWGGGDSTKTWLAPNVGIAYRHEYQTYSDGTTITVLENRIWKLLEYDLNTFSLAQFPNTVGTEWVYELVEYISGSTFVDTVTVTIVDRIDMAYRDSATIWEFEGDRYSDTMFVAVSGPYVFEMFDTLGLMPFLSWTYEFPMAVGRNWPFDGVVPLDNFVPGTLVDDKAPVVTPADHFPTGFHYIAVGGGELYLSWVVNDWVVPGVGVVKRTFLKVYDGPPITQHWTLLHYDTR